MNTTKAANRYCITIISIFILSCDCDDGSSTQHVTPKTSPIARSSSNADQSSDEAASSPSSSADDPSPPQSPEYTNTAPPYAEFLPSTWSGEQTVVRDGTNYTVAASVSLADSLGVAHLAGSISVREESTGQQVVGRGILSQLDWDAASHTFVQVGSAGPEPDWEMRYLDDNAMVWCWPHEFAGPTETGVCATLERVN